jgi:two-component system, LytTR family, response regulator LytT
MTAPILHQWLLHKQRVVHCILAFVVVISFANIVLYYIESINNKSGFYLSETLLFSSYWILYFPFLLLLIKQLKSKINRTQKILLPVALIVIHTLAYPAQVWLFSKLFYYHTFSYWQTFNFGLSAYFLETMLIYGFSLAVLSLLIGKSSSTAHQINTEPDGNIKQPITSFWVTDNNNVNILLQVSDIYFLAASSPYVQVHHAAKKYLLTTTLKSLENTLNSQQFVRIHKSCIINIHKITNYTSRQNGDYDVLLKHGSLLRVSRNYAKAFKTKTEVLTHLTAK